MVQVTEKASLNKVKKNTVYWWIFLTIWFCVLTVMIKNGIQKAPGFILVGPLIFKINQYIICQDMTVPSWKHHLSLQRVPRSIPTTDAIKQLQSRVPLEKQIFTWLVKITLAFMILPIGVTYYRVHNIRHWTPFWARWIQFTPSHVLF
jgi:hypothetical protein